MNLLLPDKQQVSSIYNPLHVFVCSSLKGNTETISLALSVFAWLLPKQADHQIAEISVLLVSAFMSVWSVCECMDVHM